MADCDLIVRNALLFDGSGAAPMRGDLAIADARIVALGALGRMDADDEIDAAGHALAPGFIDVHTHDDRALMIGDMAMKASQGVTTVVVGNCGVSLAPWIADRAPPPPLDLIGAQADYRFATFAEYLDTLDRDGIALNAACLVGHSTLRAGAMDRYERAADEGEIAAMRTRLGEALDAGAIGLSTGLAYRPAISAPTSEVSALAELLAPANAIHTTHMRNESAEIDAAMDEAFAIGRAANVPVVISHFKVAGAAHFGRTKETLPKLAAAMARQKLGVDVYPYAASSTVLDPNFIEGADRILVTWSKAEPTQAGRYLNDIARDWNMDRHEAAQRLQPAGAVYFSMDEDDVRRILSFREAMIGSDGLPHDAHPHPRLWGSFPRVLGHYAREVGLFTMQEAIRRMTGLPAERFGLKGRGRLLPGAHADLVLFDPATVLDRATFEKPMQPAAGIETVFVAGEPVWQNGKSTGAKPGRVLRRQAR
ncbi:MAG: D-aminoacylase [Dongiaceae bacterium]